jgi:polyisoprenoid-binding protein YceI
VRNRPGFLRGVPSECGGTAATFTQACSKRSKESGCAAAGILFYARFIPLAKFWWKESSIHFKSKTMATTWKVDPAHSEIQFKVKHLMITTVTGYFRTFDLEVDTETDDFSTTKRIAFSADINSIDTNNEQRDTHLKSADFFDAEQHGRLTFTGDRYAADGNDAMLMGNLTIRGITKPVTVNVEFGGMVVDPYGQTKAGFTISTRISRKDFGLTWSAVTEAGSVVVSDDIKVLGEIQLVKQG